MSDHKEPMKISRRDPSMYVTRLDLARRAHKHVKTIQKWEFWGIIPRGRTVHHPDGGSGKRLAYEPWVLERVEKISRLLRLGHPMREVEEMVLGQEELLVVASKRLAILSVKIEDHFKDLMAELEEIGAQLKRIGGE